MNPSHRAEIEAVLSEGRDMTVATVMPDGSPHATVVSFASDGQVIYFGCAPNSQKARNLGRDPRVALTITLPYRDWGEIRGLSIQGRVERLAPGEEMDRAGLLFMQRFSEIAQYISTDTAELAMFRVTPQEIGVLDYRKGFGHVDHVAA